MELDSALKPTTYAALLRGINVGGTRKVAMPKLKALFERLGLDDVKTYINSGNVIFRATGDEAEWRSRIEAAIAREFGLDVPVVLRSREQLAQLLKRLPDDWVNDGATKCDVMFLWPAIDQPGILDRIPHKPGVEDVVYFPGTVVWRVDRKNVNRGQVLKIIGGDVYRQMTVRNVNTVRKLCALM